MRFLWNFFINKVAGLQYIDKFTENKVFDKDIFQQTFAGLQPTSLRRYEELVNVAISGFSRHLEDILKKVELLCLRKTFL